MKALRRGLLTWLILQLAIGPVFFFIIHLTTQRTLMDGLVWVCAVTLVDYLFIFLAILGVRKVVENDRFKKIFWIIGSIVLIVFWVIMITSIIFGGTQNISSDPSNLLQSFASTFFLAISNPMAIIFFAGLFTSKAIEYNYKKTELLVFSFATGLSTILFMWASVIIFSLVKEAIPLIIIQILNLLVGWLLIMYGSIRLQKILTQKPHI